MSSCDPGLGAWMELKWLEDNTEEPCGLWCGNLEGWVQSLSCHKDLWADVSQVHTGPPVMWAIAALLISSLIADLCYSYSFSGFLSFCFLQFQCSDLEYSWEVLYMPRKPFSPKSYPDLQTELVDALEGWWLLKFPSNPCELKKFK